MNKSPSRYEETRMRLIEEGQRSGIGRPHMCQELGGASHLRDTPYQTPVCVCVCVFLREEE